MSSPMYDVPEHFPIPVNSQAQGPETDLSKVAWLICWCSDPMCPKFQVHGDAYREALAVLSKGRGINPEEAESILFNLIQLGWNKQIDAPVLGAIRRAEALAAGDPNWADVT